MYRKYGIDTTINLIDGVFGLIILDTRDPENPLLHAARDPIGVKPLYIGKNKLPGGELAVTGFGSEIKQLQEIC